MALTNQKLEQKKKELGWYNWGEPIQRDIFFEILNEINTNIPSMIELGIGCNPYYSYMFDEKFSSSINIGTEIREFKIPKSKEVFENCNYYHGYSGAPLDNEDIPDSFKGCVNEGENVGYRILIKNLIEEHNLTKIDILHMDIQGSEISVLEELEEYKLFDFIDYYFISVHSGDHNKTSTYYDCIKILEKNIKNIKYYYKDPFKGGYGDGLIICKNNHKI